MSNRAWMPLYLDDYLADTGHLTTLEHGAYMLLIMHYWRQNGLPDDERMIARIARLSKEEWAESRDILAALFNEGWKHKRIDAELAKADEIIAKRRAAAEHRHSKSNAHAVHVESKSTYTGASPRTNNQSSSLRSEDTRAKARSPRDELREVLDDKHAGAVAEHRQRLRKPLTPHAAKLLAGQLAKWSDPNEAADEMIEAGWAGFKPEWMKNRTAPRGQSPPGKRENAFDAYAEIAQIKGWTDEPSSIPGSDENGERLPAERGEHQGPVVDLRRGAGGDFR